MTNYIAIIHKDSRSDFGVSFPDLPGCISAGRTIDEAKESAQEALSLHIQGMLEDGEEVPAPSSLEDVMADPENSDAVAFLVVSAPESKARAVRVNVTIPEDMLEKIDAAAKKRNMSRSSYLVQAAKSAMRASRSRAKPSSAQHG